MLLRVHKTLGNATATSADAIASSSCIPIPERLLLRCSIEVRLRVNRSAIVRGRSHTSHAVVATVPPYVARPSYLAEGAAHTETLAAARAGNLRLVRDDRR